MSYMHPDLFDTGLSQLNGKKLTLCSALPTTYAQANATYALGSKVGISVSMAAHTSGGRKAVVAPITDGAVSANGTASHWAIVDTATSRLLATRTLQTSQVVTSGNVFTIAASFDIAIPGPA
jgi:hypothetical protein